MIQHTFVSSDGKLLASAGEDKKVIHLHIQGTPAV
jgi:hypothetical protein